MLSGQPRNDTDLYRLLTISLVLGSKFLDDNTFINRSWSEVSGIQVATLNQLETEWLVAIEFKLHRDPSEQQGWQSWSDHWQDYQAHAVARANRKLSPIDTTVQRRSVHLNNNKPLPPLPMQQNYSAPPPYEFTPKSAQTSYSSASSFSQYDPWRQTSENSPASAPTTGPTTPEYYGHPGTWAPAEGYSRRTISAFHPCLSRPPRNLSRHPVTCRLLTRHRTTLLPGTAMASTADVSIVLNDTRLTSWRPALVLKLLPFKSNLVAQTVGTISTGLLRSSIGPFYVSKIASIDYIPLHTIHIRDYPFSRNQSAKSYSSFFVRSRGSPWFDSHA